MTASSYIAGIVQAAVPGWARYALVFSVGAACGAQLVAWGKNAELSNLLRTHAQVTAKAEREARTALQQAQEHGDELTQQLHNANRAAVRIQETIDDQIRQATTGRVCLDGAALRLLDRAPGIAADDVPASASGAARAHAQDAAPAAALVGSEDLAVAATDTDVALWSRAAAGQYAECVRRLDALIDWHQPNTNKP